MIISIDWTLINHYVDEDEDSANELDLVEAGSNIIVISSSSTASSEGSESRASAGTSSAQSLHSSSNSLSSSSNSGSGLNHSDSTSKTKDHLKTSGMISEGSENNGPNSIENNVGEVTRTDEGHNDSLKEIDISPIKAIKPSVANNI